MSRVRKWYANNCFVFHRAEGVPRISVSDGEGAICLIELFDARMHGSSSGETLDLKKRSLEITYVEVRVGRRKPHGLVWCASVHLVSKEGPAGQHQDLYKAKTDTDGQFTLGLI